MVWLHQYHNHQNNFIRNHFTYQFLKSAPVVSASFQLHPPRSENCKFTFLILHPSNRAPFKLTNCKSAPSKLAPRKSAFFFWVRVQEVEKESEFERWS